MGTRKSIPLLLYVLLKASTRINSLHWRYIMHTDYMTSALYSTLMWIDNIYSAIQICIHMMWDHLILYKQLIIWLLVFIDPSFVGNTRFGFKAQTWFSMDHSTELWKFLVWHQFHYRIWVKLFSGFDYGLWQTGINFKKMKTLYKYYCSSLAIRIRFQLACTTVWI